MHRNGNLVVLPFLFSVYHRSIISSVVVCEVMNSEEYVADTAVVCLLQYHSIGV